MSLPEFVRAMSLPGVLGVIVLLALAFAALFLWRQLRRAPGRQAGHATLPAGEAFVNVPVSAVPLRHTRLDYAPEDRVEGELVSNTVLRFRRREGVEGEVGVDWEIIEL